ncbi:MAG: T9SS type A sorting domain-containing protein, partial [Candidatus Poribacteria bacterium]|nr:T9SS type A sorting domain-containing protein [Candidatus Poribacteria bacterium]
DGNEILDVSPLSTLINLMILDLDGNEILDVSPLSTLINLMELDLHDNEIIDISALKNLRKLKILDLSENHITDFSPIAKLVENLMEYDNSNQASPPIKTADVNRDGVVNVMDLVLVAFNYRNPDFADAAQFGVYLDVNGDGVVDVRDLVAVAAEVDTAAAPAGLKYLSKPPVLTAENLSAWISLAKGLDAQEPWMRKGITVLEQLLASLSFTEMLPRETALLANYPNPFNPETWIPYQLAASSEVSISIHSAEGQLVQTLKLGELSAGIYHSKSRAAYWDGRNEFGESVASGVYFYTLTAGDFTVTRKMLVQK